MIQFNDLHSQWACIKELAIPRIEEVILSSSFINGKDVLLFENNYADWNKVGYAIGCSNGTDALKMAFRSIGTEKNSVVFMPANTFIATISAIDQVMPDAHIELIDCDDYYQIDVEKLTHSLETTRSSYKRAFIVPVHLYGHTVDIKAILDLAERFDCEIVEDSSQAHGAIGVDNIMVGSFGKISAFSLYPGKNLGAMGDAGVITTNDKAHFETMRAMRTHGALKKYQHEIKGSNFRLDTLQAIILDEKLKHLDQWNNKRLQVAQHYNKNIKNQAFKLPIKAPYCGKHVYHIYCVRLIEGSRDIFQKYLKDRGIPTVIHYPVPIECTGAYSHLDTYSENTRRWSNQLISLPIHPFLSIDEVDYICDVLNSWQG